MLRPTKGKVFVRPLDAKRNDGIIVVPDSIKNNTMPTEGIVVAMGGKPMTKKGVVYEPEFAVNDTVIFPHMTGLWVEVRGERLILLEQHGIVAKRV